MRMCECLCVCVCVCVFAVSYIAIDLCVVCQIDHSVDKGTQF